MDDSLSNIEKKINHRIEELKDKMEKTNLRTETDRLWVRIETLQWALAQILALRYEDDSPPNQTII
jgi:polyhydroxyalkanoate synthesis regulator phasin